jgi:hypothetical protein
MYFFMIGFLGLFACRLPCNRESEGAFNLSQVKYSIFEKSLSSDFLLIFQKSVHEHVGSVELVAGLLDVGGLSHKVLAQHLSAATADDRGDIKKHFIDEFCGERATKGVATSFDEDALDSPSSQGA